MGATKAVAKQIVMQTTQTEIDWSEVSDEDLQKETARRAKIKDEESRVRERQVITAQGEMLKRAYLQLDRHLANHMAHGHDSSCGVELCALRAELELMPGVTG